VNIRLIVRENDLYRKVKLFDLIAYCESLRSYHEKFPKYRQSVLCAVIQSGGATKKVTILLVP
jgi:hypothetical protein